MATISTTTLPLPSNDTHEPSLLTPLPSPTKEMTSGPLPLPSFTSPVKSTTRPAPSYELTSTMSGMSEHRKPPPLPSFSFNPSVDSAAAYASPPISPQHGRVIPSRPTATHRRGTSEFIGGDGKTGAGTGLMSSSPTKGDNILPPPMPVGPPTGRRSHHAHRRSAAISCHDLSVVLKPTNGNAMPRGGSAPASPSDHEYQAFPGLTKSSSQPKAEPDESGPSTEDGSTPKPLSRARVDFSDNVEFIPRPISLVSSDTSSTVTVRGHSVSNSLSSIVSGSTTSSPSGKGLPSPPLSSRAADDARPRTAGPILDGVRETSQMPDGLASPTKSRSSPLLADFPVIRSSSSATPEVPSKKPWSLFGIETSPKSSPSNSRPSSANSTDKKSALSSPLLPKPVATADVPLVSLERTASRRPSVSRKPSKKQKKVKSWAGSILSRKTRARNHNQKHLSRRSPTPPLRPFGPITETIEGSEKELTSDLTSDTDPKLELQTGFISWKQRQVSQQDEESMSPIIDLDAALGPFQTPSSYDPAWGMSQKGTVPKKRKMHSAAGMSGFSGAGMHYHRRAESAPEFENPRFGFNRLGSNSTMADVFEEDEEEDEWEDAKAASDKESCNKPEDDETGLGIDIKVVDSADSQADKSLIDFSLESTTRGVKRKGSGLVEGDRKHTTSGIKSESTSLKEEATLEDLPHPVNIADNAGSRPTSRAESTGFAALPSQPRPGHALAPVEINTLAPPSYLSPTSSMSGLKSPKSPLSDSQRITSTAPSSVSEDQTFQSLLMGEPGPELVRMSVEGVPSLSSNNSTTTRDSSSIPSSAFDRPLRHYQRSASLSGPSTTKKRSSMASLSRLISSSHGERSKLSIESRPAITIEPDRREKSKSKRISRMMNFWKPKATT